MAINEKRFGSGLMQFQGKGDANLAHEVSRNGRRVLGAINENIVVGAPGAWKDVLGHKEMIEAVVTRSDIDDMLLKTVVRKELQLVGVTAMLMACKYGEVSVPVVADFIYISDKAYTRREVLNMERLMLNTLQFNMSVPSPLCIHAKIPQGCSI